MIVSEPSNPSRQVQEALHGLLEPLLDSGPDGERYAGTWPFSTRLEEGAVALHVRLGPGHRRPADHDALPGSIGPDPVRSGRQHPHVPGTRAPSAVGTSPGRDGEHAGRSS